MEIYGDYDIYKQSIYIDVDDVILESSDAILSLLNQKYSISPPKQKIHIKDYELKSIKKGLTKKEINNLFESPEFWEKVQFNPIFLHWLQDKDFLEKYNWVLLTKGTHKNLALKYDKLKNLFIKQGLKDYFSYIGIPCEEKKSKLRMVNGIQIDDNLENLKDSDAQIKILVKNNLDTNYNNYLDCDKFITELYIVSNMEQVEQILRFNLINIL